MGGAERAGSRWAISTTPRRTRKTFPGGRRPAGGGIRGPRQSLEPDGTLRLFGRDSLVVNTGGEKVFVEEVEEVLRAQPGVADALVVGRRQRAMGPGGRRARRAARRGAASTPTRCATACVEHLARFKAPKAFIVVDKVRRLGNGKADYRWAKSRSARTTGR